MHSKKNWVEQAVGRAFEDEVRVFEEQASENKIDSETGLNMLSIEKLGNSCADGRFWSFASTRGPDGRLGMSRLGRSRDGLNETDSETGLSVLSIEKLGNSCADGQFRGEETVGVLPLHAKTGCQIWGSYLGRLCDGVNKIDLFLKNCAEKSA